MRIGETSSENVRGDDRQAHVFARMERESLFRAVKATGEVLKAWLGRHQRLFNPLRSLSCSAASRSVSSTVRGDLLLSSQGEDASLGTLVMSSLRGVLDAQVMRKEKLLKQCLPTVASSVNADWCVVLEVVYTSDTPVVRVYDPSSGVPGPYMNSTEFPINSSEEEGQERDIGESLNDDEGKPCVFLSSLLQGGLLDFANWLVTSPGVAPASGETASHFLSAARVETSLNAVQDGALNLLPYDYCGGRKALQERQFQLLQHMPEGTTPVFGASGLLQPHGYQVW